MTEDQDLKDVMRAEQSRGRRKPLDVMSLDELRDAKEVCRELLRPEATEADFRRTMIALGFQPESEKYEAALRAWRALRRS
jgi:hypothetical protein